MEAIVEAQAAEAGAAAQLLLGLEFGVVAVRPPHFPPRAGASGGNWSNWN